jgi:hypothetical protein
MATSLSPEEAIERARRLQDDRLNTVRVVAEARQALADGRAAAERELSELQARIADRIGTLERDDVRAYSAALTSGWTADELRKIGFTEPDKKARTRRRAPAPRRPSGTGNDAAGGNAADSSDGD